MPPEITTIRGPIEPLDPAALADRNAILQLCPLYALAIDTRDEAMLRSLFSPEAVIRGALGEATADEYLPKLIAGVRAYSATMHTILNQYAVVQGDTGNVWNYAVAYHIPEPSSGRDDLVLGVQYRDRVERIAGGWRIAGREVVRVWSRGPAGPAPVR